MNSTQQLLAMMKEEATKNFAEGKIKEGWTEECEAMFKSHLESGTEEDRLECLADEEGRKKYSIFGLIMLKCYKPLGGLKEEEEESDEQDTDGSDEDLNGAISVSGSAF